MNIEDWLDNANIRLENRRVSYSVLATETIRAVIELHKPRRGHGMNPVCDACSDEDDDDAYLYYESGPIFTVWPCPTVRTIENVLKEHT